jgi:hypothetical protein
MEIPISQETSCPALEHYIILNDGHKQCKHCTNPDHLKIYGPKTSTNSLYHHLKATHNIDPRTMESEPRANNILPLLTQAETTKITDMFIKWIVNDIQPFTTAHNIDFKNFCKVLNPQYNIPCRQTTQKLITAEYKTYKHRVSTMLQSITGAISLTADLWTSITMDAYCGVTAHYIDDNWQSQHILLDVAPMPYPHTGK